MNITHTSSSNSWSSLPLVLEEARRLRAGGGDHQLARHDRGRPLETQRPSEPDAAGRLQTGSRRDVPRDQAAVVGSRDQRVARRRTCVPAPVRRGRRHLPQRPLAGAPVDVPQIDPSRRVGGSRSRSRRTRPRARAPRRGAPRAPGPGTRDRRTARSTRRCAPGRAVERGQSRNGFDTGRQHRPQSGRFAVAEPEELGRHPASSCPGHQRRPSAAKLPSCQAGRRSSNKVRRSSSRPVATSMVRTTPRSSTPASLSLTNSPT